MPKVLIDVKTKGAGKASKKIGGLNKSLKGLAGKAALAAGALFGSAMLIQGLKKATQAAALQELAEKKLATVLKSTSHAAGMQAKELTNLAKTLSRYGSHTDDAIIGAESLILTFTKIGKEVMPQTIETILDMSVALGVNLKEQSIQLGKALNDPIKGVGALQEVGVTLSEQQKQQVNDFMAVNDIASAQKVILDELQVEFGGMAKASGETLAGSMQKAKFAMGEAAEALGELLAPMATWGANAVSKFSKAVEQGLDFSKKIDWGETTKNFLDNWQVFGKLFLADLKTIIDFIPDFLKLAWNKLVPIAKGIFEKLSNFVKATAKFIFEPYVIAGEILWNKLKIVFQKIGASMVNSVVEKGLNPILQRMKNFASAFPKMAKKMGLDQIELIKPIDMDAVGADLIAKNKALAKELDNTPYMKLVNEILTTDDVQDFGGLLDQLKQNRVDAANELIALNAIVLKNEIDTSKNKTDVQITDAERLAAEEEKRKAQKQADFKEITGSFTKFYNRRKGLKDKELTDELKRTAMASGSASDAMKSVVKSEAMEAVVGLISSILKHVPYPFNLILAAGAGATANKFIDKGLSNIKGVAGAATGADFVTSGPQMLMVGDNTGGKERVQVTPLSSPNIDGPQGGNPITLNISGNVMTEEFTEDQVLPALREALRRGGNLDHRHGNMGMGDPGWSV